VVLVANRESITYLEAISSDKIKLMVPHMRPKRWKNARDSGFYLSAIYLPVVIWPPIPSPDPLTTEIFFSPTVA
jgi:hypothetical protein